MTWLWVGMRVRPNCVCVRIGWLNHVRMTLHLIGCMLVVRVRRLPSVKGVWMIRTLSSLKHKFMNILLFSLHLMFLMINNNVMAVTLTLSSMVAIGVMSAVSIYVWHVVRERGIHSVEQSDTHLQSLYIQTWRSKGKTTQQYLGVKLCCISFKVWWPSHMGRSPRHLAVEWRWG